MIQKEGASFLVSNKEKGLVRGWKEIANFYLGFNHVGIYMGKNGTTPYYIHAALENGLAIESPYKMIKEKNWVFKKHFIRYNTEKNPGNGKIPRK